MTTRNHNKLRPYDLAQAKVGDVVLTSDPTERGQVVALSPRAVAFVWEDGSFNFFDLGEEHVMCQPPLAWLGPDPVYAGDTLWCTDETHTAYGTSVAADEVQGQRLYCVDDWILYLDGDNVRYAERWSLTKPEPKPRFIEINGRKVPEPAVAEPDTGIIYYTPRLHLEVPVTSYFWTGDSMDYALFQRGLVHLTKEAAIAHAQALLSFTES